MSTILSEPLKLPCGAKLSNRLCKAAMSEGMAGVDNRSTPRLETLYRRWAGSGAGLLLSGNIQVDRSIGLSSLTRWRRDRPSRHAASRPNWPTGFQTTPAVSGRKRRPLSANFRTP